MGNMRDALRKANVLSKKDERRLKHQERVHRSDVGREGLEDEQRERQRDLGEKQAEDRARTQAIQQEREAVRQAAAERAACEDLLAREVVRPGSRSSFFLELPDGSLPCLGLGPVESQNLRAGAVCLVCVGPRGSHSYGLLATEHARRVHKVLPERVIWAAGGVLG